MSDESLRRDELVSAYLDGEATPAEIAEVEGDAALLARIEELRAVRDAVGAPVPTLPAEQRDQLISAALGVADTEAAARVEAKLVPPRRPQPLFLALAAAVLLVAAVVSAGLIGSRGGDDQADVTAEASPPAAAEAPAEMASADAAEEPMAEMDMAVADEEMAEEEPMAEEAMADAAAEAAMAEAAAEAAMEAAAPAEADIGTATTEQDDGETAADDLRLEEERRSEATADEGRLDAGDPPEQVVNLGTLASLESLFENIGAKWSAALEDGAMADSGACAAAVHEQALELDTETVQPLVATVGTEDPLTFDVRFARRSDGTALVIYAAPPDCEIRTHELPGS